MHVNIHLYFSVFLHTVVFLSIIYFHCLCTFFQRILSFAIIHYQYYYYHFYYYYFYYCIEQCAKNLLKNNS